MAVRPPALTSSASPARPKDSTSSASSARLPASTSSISVLPPVSTSSPPNAAETSSQTVGRDAVRTPARRQFVPDVQKVSSH